ncbi:MAG: ABC transporter ATP-binding protein [Actinomycetota bacterium]|nr:ABC transporter ATP-binding protein [Actinomycetota bacterium]
MKQALRDRLGRATDPSSGGVAERAWALELREVTKSYGIGLAATPAVAGVSLRVASGEFVAIMGPSGSGKSTLIHMAAGLEAPDTGSVAILGETMPTKVRGSRWFEARRRRIGVVFQRLNLVPYLTAAENVALPLELDGWSSWTTAAAVQAAMARTGTEALSDRFPNEMSGGQLQRVAVARGVVGERELLLADEATGALDTAAAEAIVELLAAQAAEGSAVLLVTHDSRLAAWADRVVFLRDGSVVDTSGPASPITVAADPSRGASEMTR